MERACNRDLMYAGKVIWEVKSGLGDVQPIHSLTY